MTAINSAQTVQSIRPALLPAAPADRPQREAAPREAVQASPPSDLRARLDDLIADEVASGRLSNDQAQDLHSAFDDAFTRFADAPVAASIRSDAPKSDFDAAASLSADAPVSDAASFPQGKSDASGTVNVMKKFMDALQASIDAGGASTYGPAGRNNVAAIKTVPPLVVDYQS